jgi:NAD(P)-dependent dehydrogenase (short-subunit alcohol dehydrogenase family)
MVKTIAIFGAGPGLSRSVALRFGREGFRVALVARNRERLDALAAQLAGQGIEAAGWLADLLDRDALPAVADAMTARFGPLDVLEYARPASTSTACSAACSTPTSSPSRCRSTSCCAAR